jgi:hypothetical protein
MEWDVFRSAVCHELHHKGVYKFVKDVLYSNCVFELWDNGQYAKALYLVAMVDYLSYKYVAPEFNGFSNFRRIKLARVLFPQDVLLTDALEGGTHCREEAIARCSKDECGRFFFRHNIIEGSVWDVG